MPPSQRRLPSAWDRGGLLGPRGNARFLEVDGLRVKYIGRLVGRKKKRVFFFVGHQKIATLALIFSSLRIPLSARLSAPFYCCICFSLEVYGI